MPCKTFTGRSSNEDDVQKDIDEKINEFLSDGKIVTHSIASLCFNGMSFVYFVTIFYNDPAPVGAIVVRNSPAHIPPTEKDDTLRHFRKPIGYNEEEDLREQCMNCPLHGMFGVPKDESPDPMDANQDIPF